MISYIRPTLRRLFRERGFTFTVLATLALCIGANVAIYSVVDHVLLQPLPFPHSDRLVTVFNSYPGAGVDRSSASITNYYERRNHLSAFSSISIIQDGKSIIGESASVRHANQARVSPEFFETLRIRLARGKMFDESNMLYGADQVAVITDRFWRNFFNSDPNVIGRTFLNDRLPVVVVAVLPADFHYLSSEAEFFRPASHSPKDIAPANRHDNGYTMVARLAPNGSIEQAKSEVNAFSEHLIAHDSDAQHLRDSGYHVVVASLHGDHVRNIRSSLLMLQGGAFTLLLIGGVNLLNLLLMRAHGREKEQAVRQALGAGRRHIFVDTLTETLILTGLGGMLGITVGAMAIDVLRHFGAERIPLSASIEIDLPVLGVALGGSIALGLVLALLIIGLTTKFRIDRALHADSRSGTVNRSAQRVRYGFIVAQIALAHMLLAEAGFLGLSLHKIAATSPGFSPNHVLTGTISLPWANYQDRATRQGFQDRLRDALRSTPGVTNVGFTSALPFRGESSDTAVTVEGESLAPGESIQSHYTSFASGDYWKALDIPLREGRYLEDADNQRDARVCVVDTSFANRYWPGQSALGRRLTHDAKFDEQYAFTIVGVVGTIKQNNLASNGKRGTVYFTYRDYQSNSYSVVLHTTLPSEALVAPLQQAVKQIDPNLPVEGIQTLQSLVDRSLVTRKSPALLSSAFASIALLLSAVGTYGVLAYAVNQRRREIGIRMALGALPQQVSHQFLRLGVALLAGGIACGTLGAWFAAQATQSLFFETSSSNPAVFATTALALVAVVLAAVFIPSRQATRVNPIEALRAE